MPLSAVLPALAMKTSILPKSLITSATNCSTFYAGWEAESVDAGYGRVEHDWCYREGGRHAYLEVTHLTLVCFGFDTVLLRELFGILLTTFWTGGVGDGHVGTHFGTSSSGLSRSSDQRMLSSKDM